MKMNEQIMKRKEFSKWNWSKLKKIKKNKDKNEISNFKYEFMNGKLTYNSFQKIRIWFSLTRKKRIVT